MRTLRPAVVAALLLALAGCAEVTKLARSAFAEPKLTFRSASLQALDLEGATIGFQFDLENPNAFGLSLARLGYGVEVEGSRVATGDLPGGLKIPASGTAPVTFPVHVRFQDVPGIVSILGSRDRIAYRLSGNVGVSTPIGVIDLPLSHQDTLALPRLPGFAIDGLAIRSVSFDSVGLDVKVRVKNPNAFPLPGGRIAYALSVAGSPVARADGQATQHLQGGQSAVVTIPVKVDLARAGLAATELVRGEAVDVRLTGTADVAGVPVPLDLAARLPARR
jgi:LEA14-like dessication related protein